MGGHDPFAHFDGRHFVVSNASEQHLFATSSSVPIPFVAGLNQGDRQRPLILSDDKRVLVRTGSSKRMLHFVFGNELVARLFIRILIT